MGLAAYGNSDVFFNEIRNVLRIRDIDKLEFRHTVDLIGNSFARKIRKYAEQYKREDIAAATQRLLEEIMEEIVRHFVKKTGVGKVVLNGGVAMNVKMNQRIRELNCVEDLYIFPNMTDGGLSAGAALAVYYRLSKSNGKELKNSRLADVFLGPTYSNIEIKKAIDKKRLKYRFYKDIDKKITNLVANGFIVARFKGRMEFGPRALGSRTILALPFRLEIKSILNDRLKRDEFMPFAPSILEKYAVNEYLANGKKAPYMTETFIVKNQYVDKFPAVIHIDGTLRPQTVSSDENPVYYRLVKLIGDLTGY